MIQLASGIKVDHLERVDLSDSRFRRDWPAFEPNRASNTLTRPSARADEQGQDKAACWSDAPKPRERRKRSYSLRSMEFSDIKQAMRIAADNFRGEIGLVARSYMWHFGRRIGLGNIGAMWTRRQAEVTAPGEPTLSFDIMSSFVHDRDVVWVDLGGRKPGEIAVAAAAFQHWSRHYRLVVVRAERAHLPQLVAAGFTLAGRLPDGLSEHVYLHAACDRIKNTGSPKLKIRLRGRRSLASSCDFGVVEREGVVLGLTGVYEAGFWRDVTWGAWGAVDRASARRDAVFEILRLTEERARSSGARWFCLETSDSERYRHARRIYELHGLELLLSVPDFYRSSDGTSEALLVFGKPLVEKSAPVKATVTRNVGVALAA
jgi:hypothetical protein